MRKALVLMFAVAALTTLTAATMIDAPLSGTLRKAGGAVSRLVSGMPTQLDLQKHIDAALAREPRDAAWGQMTAARLRPEIEKAMPQGSALRAFECRESMCRVETLHRDRAGYDAFIRAVVWDSGKPMLWQSGATFLEPRSPEPQGSTAGLLSVGYLLREGRTLPTPIAFEGATG